MTRDLAEIEADFKKWPDATSALPTGEVNGFWVVEADTEEGHGVDGVALSGRVGEQARTCPRP